MIEKDLNRVAKIERAIKEKYGKEAVQNPKSLWSEEKEREYLEDLKEFYNNLKRKENLIEIDGLKIRTRKSKEHQERTCPVCSSYSFSSKDDLYMNKFQCCFKCYVQHVEDREERWKSGWRPNK
jgi:hypothetical protein